MRRPTLSTKLIAAALPLVIAVVALLAVTVRSDLNDVGQAENGAELGGVWEPLIGALAAIETESSEAAADPGSAPEAATRQATDQAVNLLRDDVESIGAAEAAGAHITAGRSALSAARRNLDMASLAPDLQTEIDPFDAYTLAGRELVAVGQLLPSEAADPQLGRELLAVVKLAEAKLKANDVIAGTQRWEADRSDTTSLATARSAFLAMEAALSEFEAVAPAEWATLYRQSGFPSQLAQFRSDLDGAARPAQSGQAADFDSAAFGELVDRGVQFQSAISQEIVERSSIQGDTARRTTLIRIGISLAAVVLAALIALFISRSITRRIKTISESANQVATEQLPALVSALRDPRGKSVLPEIHPVDASGHDELAELAGAFNSMQDTLVHVAHEQVEVLRRGVSDIFVTMARRNRSLIDRQLAMLDEFEAEVDDPSVLSNYYQLDHLATRMRRNSESLLVLAGTEPKRRRVKATEIDDVVRASIGEVEDYRRIDIEHLESLQVRGTVVADVSHLIAELLDNATAFSPPESPVRVGGRRSGDTYLLRIVDSGIGIPTERLREINDLLREPPIVGLSVESTLGMSVVSLLANKHDITVTLSAGNPGLTVDITLPSTLFGPIDVPPAAPFPPRATVADTAEEPIVAWNDAASEPGQAVDESFAPAADLESVPFPPEPTAAPTVEPMAVPAESDHPHIAAADWTRMSASLSAFQSGQQSALSAQAEPAATTIDEPVEESVFEPIAEPIAETAPATIEPPVIEPTTEPDPALPVPEPEPLAPTAAPSVAATTMPPPPPTTRVPGEFDTPLAPPISPDGPSRGPVAPATARPAPPLPADPTPAHNGLPTRTPSSGPTGPDRLADVAPPGDDDPDSQSGPGALQAALAAFDASRTGFNGSSDTGGAADSLPTRSRVDEPISMPDESIPVTASRLDPDALRERLRAFQAESRGTAGDEHPSGDAMPATDHDHHSDLGGDRR